MWLKEISTLPLNNTRGSSWRGCRSYGKLSKYAETVDEGSQAKLQVLSVEESNSWEEHAIQDFHRPRFKASKDSVTHLLGNSAAGTLNPILIFHSENPRTFGNYTKSTLHLLCNWIVKSNMIVFLKDFFHQFINLFLQYTLQLHNLYLVFLFYT